MSVLCNWPQEYAFCICSLTTSSELKAATIAKPQQGSFHHCIPWASSDGLSTDLIGSFKRSNSRRVLPRCDIKGRLSSRTTQPFHSQHGICDGVTDVPFIAGHSQAPCNGCARYSTRTVLLVEHKWPWPCKHVAWSQLPRRSSTQLSQLLSDRDLSPTRSATWCKLHQKRSWKGWKSLWIQLRAERLNQEPGGAFCRRRQPAPASRQGQSFEHGDHAECSGCTGEKDARIRRRLVPRPVPVVRPLTSSRQRTAGPDRRGRLPNARDIGLRHSLSHLNGRQSLSLS